MRHPNSVMMTSQKIRGCPVAAEVASILLLTAFLANGASGYVPDDRWTTTANGSTGSDGDPITLTWSFAPDGTSIPGEGASNLIAYLDGKFGDGSGGSNLTQRPWFHLFAESLDRWSDLGGITFVYEPSDSGSQLQTSGGALGVRGDIRFGGANVDGSSGTLAYTWLPNVGDMVLDTGETNFFSNSANNYRRLRNTLMHEIGHAFGLLHVESSSDDFLMEPYIDTGFDGPQLDDIRGIHGMYGDALEKSNNGLGNDTASRATSLGALSSGGSLAIGTDAAPDQAVSAADTDFVSIANSGDFDYFSFSLSAPALVDLTLTPRGGVFYQGVEGKPQSVFDANARNDLSLALYASNSTTLIASANSTGAGRPEQLFNQSLTTAGTYYVRVSGASSSVQLYELSLSAENQIIALPGDYNEDGLVDAADYTVWRNTRGQTGAGLVADGNGNGVVDASDLNTWRANFGQSDGKGAGAGPAAVPEPSTFALAALMLAVLGRVGSCRRSRCYVTR